MTESKQSTPIVPTDIMHQPEPAVLHITHDIVDVMSTVDIPKRTSAVGVVPHEHLFEDSTTVHESEKPLQLHGPTLGVIKSTNIPTKAIENTSVLILDNIAATDELTADECRAFVNINQQQALQVIETTTEEAVESILKTERPTYQPKQEFCEQSAVEIITHQPHIKEGPLKKLDQPTEKLATPTLYTNEEIIISNVQPQDSHQNIPNFLGMENPRQANLEIVTSTHITVTETNSDELANKFYPELIVATETAQQNYNILHEYTTEIPNVNEIEQQLHKPNERTPQHAQYEVIPENYLVQQTDVTVEDLGSLDHHDLKKDQANIRFVENVSTDRYQQTAIQGEVMLPDLKISKSKATSTLHTLPVASTLQQMIHETEMNSPIEPTHPENAEIVMGTTNLIVEQSHDTSMESFEPLINFKPYEHSAYETTNQAFAQNVEVTTAYESAINNKEILPNFQAADSTITESKEEVKGLFPEILTGKPTKHDTISNTHITNYITYRHHTTPKNTTH